MIVKCEMKVLTLPSFLGQDKTEEGGIAAASLREREQR
jgi:hypothetical protein